MSKLLVWASALGILVSALGASPSRGQGHGHGGGGGGGGQGSIMGRVRTMGFEICPEKNFNRLEGGNSANITADTTLKRSGNQSVKFDSTATNQLAFKRDSVYPAEEAALGQTIYFRAYLNFTSFPTVDNSVIFRLYNETDNLTGVITVKISTSHTLRLFQDVAGTQIGGDSAVLQTGVWYRVELSCLINTGAVDQAELRLDGISVASGSGLTLSETHIATWDIGFASVAPGANSVANLDDFAVNTSGGSTQNSWCGAGSIVLLKPVSDNARGGWTGGAGGTTNLWDAVDNTPPVGNSAALETDVTQIKNLVSSATDNCDLNVTSYTTAGIAAADTITLVQAVCVKGDSGTLSLRNGALTVVSNPAQSVEDTFDYNETAIAVANFPNFWAAKWGTAQVSPSVTMGTSPVLRVGKRTATTREVDVCFMGLYVEYVPAVTMARRLPLLGAGK